MVVLFLVISIITFLVSCYMLFFFEYEYTIMWAVIMWISLSAFVIFADVLFGGV